MFVPPIRPVILFLLSLALTVVGVRDQIINSDGMIAIYCGLIGCSIALYCIVRGCKHTKTYRHPDGDKWDYHYESVTAEELSPGDQISVQLTWATYFELKWGRNKAGTFWDKHSAFGYHHGIYLGQIEGRNIPCPHLIADYGAFTEEYPLIRPLEQFRGERTALLKRVYTDGPLQDYSQILKEAKKWENNADWGQYNKKKNNCEHFASYLKTGKMWSSQVAVVRDY